MKSKAGGKGAFERIAEGLYRYRSKGMYYARFRVNGKNTGYFSLKTTDRAEAKRKLADARRLREKVEPRAAKVTLETLLGSYVAGLQRFSKSTQVTRQGIARIFSETFQPGLGKKVSEVKPSELEVWLAERTAEKSLRASSYNEYVRFLRQLFEIAVRDRMIAESPMLRIKEKKREKPIRETPTWEEFEAIIADMRAEYRNADAQDSADFAEFMGRAGVGNSEAAALRWKHVDWKKQRITLLRNKTSVGYVIPIFPGVKKLLEKIRENWDGEPEVRVFQVKDCRKALAGACKRLGFVNYTQRSLRRAFITRAVEQGIDFKTIASWQGHRDGGVLIASTYSHLRTEHADEMAKRLT